MAQVAQFRTLLVEKAPKIFPLLAHCKCALKKQKENFGDFLLPSERITLSILCLKKLLPVFFLSLRKHPRSGACMTPSMPSMPSPCPRFAPAVLPPK